MAEYTKGELTLAGNCYLKDKNGKIVMTTSHMYGLPAEQQWANTKEFLRRWNSQPDLLDACKAWMLVESEMADNHPCPDLNLRAQYRKNAVKLTTAAIAAAKESDEKTKTQ